MPSRGRGQPSPPELEFPPGESSGVTFLVEIACPDWKLLPLLVPLGCTSPMPAEGSPSSPVAEPSDVSGESGGGGGGGVGESPGASGSPLGPQLPSGGCGGGGGSSPPPTSSSESASVSDAESGKCLYNVAGSTWYNRRTISLRRL